MANLDPLRTGGTVGHMMLRSLQRYAPLEAVVAEGERLTYAALGRRVQRMTAAFAAVGLHHGGSLALLSRNRADVLVAYIAAYMAGIRLTPMPALAAEDDQAFMLADGEIQALLVDDKMFAERGRVLQRRTPGLTLMSLGPTEGAIDLMELMQQVAPAPLAVHCSPDDIATLGYTGGTTGRPKGVVHTQASLLASVQMMASEWEWPDELRMMAATPASHAAGILALPTHLRGGSFHLLPGFDPDGLLAYIEAERITATFLVPTMIYRLLESPALGKVDHSSLKTLIYGAAPMAPARLREALAVFGPIFLQIYGQGEAPMCIAFLGRSQHLPDHPGRLASCGVPHATADVALLDGDLQPVAPGEMGEICVRGPLVMKEYWKRPEETAEAFAGDWLHTGDMGRFDEDGFLAIVDRKKDMVISGGFNVYPREIEDVLTQHPDVAMASVVGVPDPVWGEAVTALVVPRAGATLDGDALIQLVRARKGPTHAPKRLLIVDTLPVTLLGKPDKKAIRAMLA